MPGITLAQAEARLTDYLNAEERALAGQSYTINGRSLSRANLNEIRAGIDAWDTRIKRLSRGGARVRQITPVSN